MADAATVSSKGQGVIPTRLRKKYGLRAGTRVVFLEKDNRLVLQPQIAESILALCGKYAGLPLEEDLLAFRHEEEKRLERKCAGM